MAVFESVVYAGLISIHAPLAGSDSVRLISVRDIRISIHAPLAGSDPFSIFGRVAKNRISIHAPLAGSDL